MYLGTKKVKRRSNVFRKKEGSPLNQKAVFLARMPPHLCIWRAGAEW
jgi:hypothetical protein